MSNLKHHLVYNYLRIFSILLLFTLLIPVNPALAKTSAQDSGPVAKNVLALLKSQNLNLTNRMIMPASGPELLQDSSFESSLGYEGYWGQVSTNAGTPLCSISDCGTDAYAGPRSGSIWAWFG